MTYDEALAYWFTQVNFETRTPVPDDMKLERTRALLAALGDPHRRLRIVHVAGSKGKGSVAAMLSAVLSRAGYRSGLFTSPHLVALEERFQVDGTPISRPELAQLLDDCRTADRAGHLAPTFFELATAMSFLHFERRGCGAAVVEVGLGGRLDSTNVCTPILSVITSISRDHTKLLGDRLSSIAREKAGIIKRGRPVVSGVTGSEAAPVIEEVAASLAAPLRRAGHEFSCEYIPGKVSEEATAWPRVRVRTTARQWPWLELRLLGEHQAGNAAIVVACVEELRRQGWTIHDEAVAHGLREVKWPARMEVLRRRPLVVLDCAHNVASARALAATLAESFPPGPRTLVFAVSNDKDVPGMFRELRPAFDRAVLTRYTENPRAVPPEELLAHWGDGGETAPTPEEAVRLALAGEGMVCITGSVFLAGQVRRLLSGG